MIVSLQMIGLNIQERQKSLNSILLRGARGDSSSLICEKSEAVNETYKESYPQDVEKDLVKS